MTKEKYERGRLAMPGVNQVLGPNRRKKLMPKGDRSQPLPYQTSIHSDERKR
jgi:hypothetical protein